MWEFNAPKYVSFNNGLEDDAANGSSFFDDNNHLENLSERLPRPRKSIFAPAAISRQLGVVLGDLTNKIEEKPSITEKPEASVMPNFQLGSKSALLSDVIAVHSTPKSEAPVPAEPIEAVCSVKPEEGDLIADDKLKQRKILQNLRRQTLEKYKIQKKRLGRQQRFKSMAEFIRDFQVKTPARFHTSTEAFKQQKHKQVVIHPTVAKTPNLRSLKRNRPVNALSEEERENLVVQEMKSFKFKANRVNPAVLAAPYVPEKKPRRAELKVDGPTLRTLKRPRRRCSSAPEVKVAEFHAQPLPEKILQKPVGIPEKEPAPVTIPKSPGFALKSRSVKWNEQKQFATLKMKSLKEIKQKLKRQASLPKFQPLQATVLQPFSFQARVEDSLKKKQEKLEEAARERAKVPKFRARSVSFSSTPTVPPKKVIPPTKPSPFNLKSLELAQRNLQQIMERHRMEEIQRKEAAVFKAKPCSVTKQQPFVPTLEHQCTVPDEVVIHSTVRAARRESFEKKLQQKEEEWVLLQEKRKLLKEEEEKEELRKFREGLCFKARPAPKSMKNLKFN